MVLPGDKFNGTIEVRSFRGIFGISHRQHDANPPALTTAYGGQYLAPIGRSVCAFRRHPQALSPGLQRAVVPLEGWLHGQVRGSGDLQAASNR